VSARRGVTLVELLVVIAILGLVAGLSSVALRGMVAPREEGSAGQLLAMRREAIRTGRPHTGVVRAGATLHVVTAYADGRLLSEPALPADYLSESARHATP
jgi:prepilin-type N-terminal cleavage/methylation domain-containing protein